MRPSAALSTPGRRRALFFGLYACEGAPIGFIWWALPAKLRAAGAPVEAITALTAMVVLPWTFKFLWAPLIDRFARSPRQLSRWIFGAELCMALTLLPLLKLDLAASMGPLTALLVAHALCAATQDVAIDALAITTVPEAERGSINGWMQAGMLLGRSLFGGGALAAQRFVSFSTVVTGVVIWLLAFGALVLTVRAPARHRELAPVLPKLLAALRQRETWLGLGIALTVGAGFEGVGALAGPFLIDHGQTPERVGTLLFLPAVVAMTAGSLGGGRLADRFGVVRTTAAAVLAVAVAAGALALAARAGAGSTTLLVLLAAVYLGIGLLTASSYALLMRLTDERLAATQFSAFMGATNGCEAWSGWVGGRITHAAGYPAAPLPAQLENR